MILAIRDILTTLQLKIHWFKDIIFFNSYELKRHINIETFYFYVPTSGFNLYYVYFLSIKTIKLGKA
jgi:hypothetical protein